MFGGKPHNPRLEWKRRTGHVGDHRRRRAAVDQLPRRGKRRPQGGALLEPAVRRLLQAPMSAVPYPRYEERRINVGSTLTLMHAATPEANARSRAGRICEGSV